MSSDLIGTLAPRGRPPGFPDNGFSPGSSSFFAMVGPDGQHAQQPLFELVVKCFFWGMQALTNIGGNLHPTSMPEIWLSLLCVVCGMFTFRWENSPSARFFLNIFCAGPCC